MKLNDRELQAPSGLLLGLELPWRVEAVNLDLEGKQVEIRLGWSSGQKANGPVCGVACALYDLAPARAWRHLDTLQFQTIIRARAPRVAGPTDGVKPLEGPWAEPQGRLRRPFERFASDGLLCARSVQGAAALLGLTWDEVEHILRRAVKRGVSRRQFEGLSHLGIDEKSFMAGQSYISLLTDWKGRRVLEVVEGRTQEAAEALWETWSAEQRQEIEAVAVDLWEPFTNAIRAKVPAAEIVHDKFHVVAHLNEAVDKVRRGEHTELMAAGAETLQGTRPWWGFKARHLTEEQTASFAALRDRGLKVARAWTAKALFSPLCTYRSQGAARRFFRDGYSWVSRRRLKPLIKVAKRLKKPLENILTCLRHPLTKAVTAGLNSKIQRIKSNARGFRNFENYRTRILFFCGKLDLYPL